MRLIAGLLLLGCLSACSNSAEALKTFAQETAIVLDGAAPATTLTPDQVVKWTRAAGKTRADAFDFGGK